MKSDIWMPIYIGDYLRDTMSLSTIEHGCYLLLLMHYWTEKRLTDNIDELLATARLPVESRSTLEKILNRYFQHEGDCFRQKRIEAEIERTARLRDRNIKNGRRGGRPRKTPTKNPNETQKKGNPQSQSQSKSKPEKEEDIAAKKAAGTAAKQAEIGSQAKRCLDYYFQKHVEERGFEPMIDGGRDMAIFKRLLKFYTGDAIREITDFFFAYKKRSKFTTRALYNSFDTLYGVLKDKKDGKR